MNIYTLNMDIDIDPAEIIETMEHTKLGSVIVLLTEVGIRFAWCALICFIAWLVTRVSIKLTSNFYRKQVEKSKLSLTERKAETLNTLTNSVVRYVVYFFAIFTILRQLGVSDSSLLVVASAGSVAIGLGAQNIVTDMMEGFFIIFEDNYAVGDIITIQGVTGTVESVTLRATKIRDPEGSVHIIPNGSIGTVTNLCMEYRNAVVEVGVAYHENIDRVLAILENEVSQAMDIESILETPRVVGVIALDDSAVTIRVVAKCEVKTHFATANELRRRIKNRLDKEGVEIPFPQRTVYIRKEES
ncbi:MAG: mechanosensitive ion channel family protein [Bacillota bacterium]